MHDVVELSQPDLLNGAGVNDQFAAKLEFQLRAIGFLQSRIGIQHLPHWRRGADLEVALRRLSRPNQ